MERVRERTFSYRPNVRLDPNADHLLSCAGVVSRVDENGPLAVVPVESLSDDIVYVVGSNVFRKVCEAMGRSETEIASDIEGLRGSPQHLALRERLECLCIAKAIRDCRLVCGRSSKLRANDGSACHNVTGYYLLPYRPGLDGSGTFNQAFHDDPGKKGYQWVLVKLPKKEEEDIIETDVVAGWWRTIEHLKDDTSGHLAEHPKIGARQPDPRTALDHLLKAGWRPGDLVYYEREKTSGRVVTMGHHFRYRWRYRDSVHRTHDVDQQKAQLRAVLCPAELELPGGDSSRPRALTVARRLFGYTTATDQRADENNEPQAPLPAHSSTLQTGIGVKRQGDRVEPTDFSQLAGRLTFNTAIEFVPTGKTDEERFLNSDHNFLVPLRPLGSPKPSAVERYLIQDPHRLALREDAGILNTYGDTLDDPSAGEPAGRKFYLHQPDAAGFGGEHCFELCRLDPDPSFWSTQRPLQARTRQSDWRMAEDKEMFFSNQAAIGRFVSRPTTEFRTTLRFSNLDWWELGAVLLCLTPTRAKVQCFGEKLGRDGQPILAYLDKCPKDERLFANKLGHGRPLGLGSVEFALDNGYRLCETAQHGGQVPPAPGLSEMTDQEVDKALTKLADFLNDTGDRHRWVTDVFLPWLRVHQYAGRRRYDYPRGEKDEKVYSYHTGLRSEHIGGRKKKRRPRNEAQRRGLKRLEES